MTNGYTLKTGRASRPDRSFPIVAEELLRAGDADGAAEICRRGLVHYPENITGYALLAEAFLQLGQPTRALNVLEDGYRRTGADGLRSMAALLEERDSEDARPEDLLVTHDDDTIVESGADDIIDDDLIDDDIVAEEIVDTDHVVDDAADDTVVTPSVVTEPLFEEEQADRAKVSLFDGTEMAEEIAPAPQSLPSTDPPTISESGISTPKPVDPELETPFPSLPRQSDTAAKIPSAHVPSLLLPTPPDLLSEAEEEIERAVERTIERTEPREPGLIAEDAPFMVDITRQSPEPIIRSREVAERDDEIEARDTEARDADDVGAEGSTSLWGEERPDAEEVYFADAGSEFSILDMAVEEIGPFMEESKDRRGREKEAARTEEENDPETSAASSSESAAPFILYDEPASFATREIPSTFMEETPADAAPSRAPEKGESSTHDGPAPTAEPLAATPTPAPSREKPARQPVDAPAAPPVAAPPITAEPSASDPPTAPRPLSIHSGTQISRLRSSNLRLIPGLEFAPLRRDEPGMRISPLVTGGGREEEEIEEKSMAPAEPAPTPPQRERRRDNPYLPGAATDDESMTPLEELARRLETARIPIVAEEGTPDLPAFEPSIVSETFAAILAEQGAYAEAIKAYQMLAFLKPEQRAAYEVKIEEMRWKMTSIVDERPPEEEV